MQMTIGARTPVAFIDESCQAAVEHVDRSAKPNGPALAALLTSGIQAGRRARRRRPTPDRVP